MVLSALFCFTCSLFQLVCRFLASKWDGIVYYGSTYGLNVMMSVSLSLPYELSVKAFNTLFLFSVFARVILRCSVKVRRLSNVFPRIFGCLMVGMM